MYALKNFNYQENKKLSLFQVNHDGLGEINLLNKKRKVENFEESQNEGNLVDYDKTLQTLDIINPKLKQFIQSDSYPINKRGRDLDQETTNTFGSSAQNLNNLKYEFNTFNNFKNFMDSKTHISNQQQMFQNYPQQNNALYDLQTNPSNLGNLILIQYLAKYLNSNNNNGDNNVIKNDS